jgi:flagellar biosynthetic protein FlhB
MPAAQVAPKVGGFAYEMVMQMVTTLTVIAALDYAYQRWNHERGLKMTKQEVKDEYRDSEGNPEIKSRIRQKQREGSRRRMMSDVPKATVVLTNPTHYAVALQYEMGQTGAPKVLAKGQDLVALRIREIATEHGIPIIENPPLARALHKGVDVGREIPSELFRAVAEVLAYVWRLDRVGTRKEHS